MVRPPFLMSRASCGDTLSVPSGACQRVQFAVFRHTDEDYAGCTCMIKA